MIYYDFKEREELISYLTYDVYQEALENCCYVENPSDESHQRSCDPELSGGQARPLSGGAWKAGHRRRKMYFLRHVCQKMSFQRSKSDPAAQGVEL